MRKLVMDAANPFQRAFVGSVDYVGSIWKKYLFLVDLQGENRDLKKNQALLVNQLLQYKEGYLEGKRLQRLLHVSEQTVQTVAVARVLDRNQSSLFKTVIIDRGSSHGVKVGMPVVNDQGVVGRVIETSWHSSRVLLIISENSNTDALTQESRAQGILQGNGFNRCSLKYISKTEKIEKGNIVLSSGIADVFPKGLPLGIITSVNKMEGGLFQEIEVTPYVNFSKLEEVVVLNRASNK